MAVVLRSCVICSDDFTSESLLLFARNLINSIEEPGPNARLRDPERMETPRNRGNFPWPFFIAWFACRNSVVGN
jgi:hypothetical protein